MYAFIFKHRTTGATESVNASSLTDAQRRFHGSLAEWKVWEVWKGVERLWHQTATGSAMELGTLVHWMESAETPDELAKRLIREVVEEVYPDGREYVFNCLLSAAIRVPGAKDEADARARLADSLVCADSNFGSWPNGDPILGEASLAYDIQTPRLYEVAGEPVDNAHAPGAILTDALVALAEQTAFASWAMTALMSHKVPRGVLAKVHSNVEESLGRPVEGFIETATRAKAVMDAAKDAGL